MASLPGPAASAASAEASPAGAAPAAAPLETGFPYVGLVTRAISFALDAVVLNLVAIIVGLGASLILSLLHLPTPVKTILAALGGAVYILWLVGYFVVFWSTTGQTPGARVMQIQVQTGNGETINPLRALIRAAGVFLAALPLFLGFAPVLFDARRRALQDYLAGTVVVAAPTLSVAARLRAQRRAPADTITSG
jgi:uncharacterized RDD family membrane protein YckC